MLEAPMKKEYSKLNKIISKISPTVELRPKIIQAKEERVNLVNVVKVLVKMTAK